MQNNPLGDIKLGILTNVYKAFSFVYIVSAKANKQK
jgi:hypothetical protein